MLIFIDDMGWRDTAFNGSDLYKTPNIDRLRNEGMLFSDAYAAAGNCAPSRACLLSGGYTPRHGVYAVMSTKRGPVPAMRLEPIPNSQELRPDVVTMAEALRASGYATAMFGKWHLGGTPATRPEAQGFEVCDAVGPPSDEAFRDSDDPKWIYRITEGACRFMEENRERPFFVYVSHHATHMGIQARGEMMDRFEAKGPGTLHRHTRFAAMNAQMDDGVGRLLGHLDDLGLAGRTLVVFTSDNGGLPQSSQSPLRGFKGMYYEGGIRVPFIVRWPGVVEPGATCGLPIINVDLYPTFLEAAGAAVPDGVALDGTSLLPALRCGADSPEAAAALGDRPVFWHFPGYLDGPNPGSRDPVFRARPVTTVRRGPWKLHLFHEEWALDGGRERIETNGAVELYHLGDDIAESRNLASDHPGVRERLVDDVLAFLERTGGRIAWEPNPNFRSAAPAPDRSPPPPRPGDDA